MMRLPKNLAVALQTEIQMTELAFAALEEPLAEASHQIRLLGGAIMAANAASRGNLLPAIREED